MNAVHATKLELMRELAGELDAARASEVRGHVGACLECRRRHDELALVQSEGRAVAPPLVIAVGSGSAPAVAPSPTAAVAAGNAERPRSRVVLWIAPALAAAAAMLFALSTTTTTETGTETLVGPSVRQKGGDTLELSCRAPGSETVRHCASGDVVAPDTAVMFRTHLGGDRYLMMLGRDSATPWLTYFPRSGDASARVDRDTSDFLSASVVLDATPGKERFVLFISDRPFDRAAVERAAENPSLLPEDIRAIDVALEKGQP